jgi:4-aminobutyrate aminotransferase-like enzyme
LMDRLNKLKGDMPLIAEVRGLGLMVGIELVSDEKRTPATAETEAVRDHCLAAGVLVGVGGVYGNVLRVQPPLIITRPQIDQAVDAIAHAVEQVQAKQAATAR